MHPIVFHIASGHAFFSGVALVVLAVLAATRSRLICRRATMPLLLVGASLVVLSSTAISYCYYAVMFVAAALWASSYTRVSWRRWTGWTFVVVLLGGGLLELPYHFVPTLTPASGRELTIIGDSVTAGVGGNEKAETWPNILAREHQLEVQDISHVGETAASALRRAQGLKIESPVVVVEIGGNDVLGSTSATQFARDLDALLKHLAISDRQVVMLELPLPPLCHEYGRMQRAAAAKHGVRLVPKRVFLSVLAGGESTLDTIHLSQAGHQQMADRIWSIVRPAFEPAHARP